MSQSLTPSQDLRELMGPTLAECTRIWRHRINLRLRPLGLSQSSWLTLWHLSWFPEGLVQSELADRLGIEGPTLVRMLDRLESAGLVKRQSLAKDRRCKRVMITEEAKPVIVQVKQVIADLRAEVLSSIPDEELRQALKVLNLIREKLASA